MIETRPPADPQEEVPLGQAAPRPVSFTRRLRRAIFGNPIASEHTAHTLLPKITALPVFASDAISSVAYATQEILLALGAAGLWVMSEQERYTRNTLLISGLIVTLLAIVVISYWQTIFGYPSGGGSYIVSKDNLGVNMGLIAAAALLIDYVLTVSVSIASGVQNLSSIPFLVRHNLDKYPILTCLLFILLLTLANLRGLKESGSLFAIPTYIFVAMCYLMIFLGIFGPFIGWQLHLKEINDVYRDYQVSAAGAQHAAETFGLAVLLRAFANGCSAMTGTEAVSNGIPAFKEPKSRNAAFTLLAMGIILGTIFMGISWLATHLHIVYYKISDKEAPAVIDQISGAIFGKTGRWSFLYLTTQIFTAGILVLAANTSFADFPRLASILARDRFLPKQFSNLGDKLVFNNGIMLLGVFAGLLIVIKRGDTDALIPLYAIGVFMAFTLSQSGMVKHWFKLKVPGWRVKAAINGIGAVATFVVLCDIAYEKFTEGAYYVIALIALLYLMFRKIYSHYAAVAQQLKMADYRPPAAPLKNTVLVLIPTLHRGVMPALEYGRSLSADVRAVHIENDPEKTPQLKERWEHWGGDVPLVILNSPYRSLISPIMHYLDAVQVERRNHLVTVVIPEFVPTKWWHSLLHGNSGLLLKLALLGRKDVIVANVRYQLQELGAPPPPDALAEEMAPAAPAHDSHAAPAGPGATRHDH